MNDIIESYQFILLENENEYIQKSSYSRIIQRYKVHTKQNIICPGMSTTVGIYTQGVFYKFDKNTLCPICNMCQPGDLFNFF